MARSTTTASGRWRVVGVLAGVVVVVSGPWASASCVGPMVVELQGLEVAIGETSSDAVLNPGGELVVVGELYRDGCDDTAAHGIGCGLSEQSSEETPMTMVPVAIVSADQTWDLGLVDAVGDRYTVTWSGLLPEDLPSGPAEVHVGSASIEVVVTDTP